jgi:hypothetical protein
MPAEFMCVYTTPLQFVYKHKKFKQKAFVMN